MNKQISILTKKRGTSPQRLSMRQFVGLVRKYQLEFEAIRDSILDAQGFVSAESELWPDQCDSIIVSIKSTKSIIKNFIRMLDDMELLPLAINPIRYPLVVRLHHLDELTSEMMIDTIELREICQPPTREASTLQLEILQILEDWVQESADLLQNIDMLYDQILFMPKSSDSS